MEAAAVSREPWTFAQRGIVVLAIVLGLWSLAGLIANPDFATGDNATAEQVLGVDFNGWHAVSGFLLLAPAFLMALRPGWALFYALYAAAVLAASAVWALLDTEPANLLAFPNNESDAALHFGFAAAFLAVAAVQLRRDRATP
jgi:uncharacterized protein DUF4383